MLTVLAIIVIIVTAVGASLLYLPKAIRPKAHAAKSATKKRIRRGSSLVRQVPNIGNSSLRALLAELITPPGVHADSNSPRANAEKALVESLKRTLSRPALKGNSAAVDQLAGYLHEIVDAYYCGNRATKLVLTPTRAKLSKSQKEREESAAAREQQAGIENETKQLLAMAAVVKFIGNLLSCRTLIERGVIRPPIALAFADISRALHYAARGLLCSVSDTTARYAQRYIEVTARIHHLFRDPRYAIVGAPTSLPANVIDTRQLQVRSGYLWTWSKVFARVVAFRFVERECGLSDAAIERLADIKARMVILNVVMDDVADDLQNAILLQYMQSAVLACDPVLDPLGKQTARLLLKSLSSREGPLFMELYGEYIAFAVSLWQSCIEDYVALVVDTYNAARTKQDPAARTLADVICERPRTEQLYRQLIGRDYQLIHVANAFSLAMNKDPHLLDTLLGSDDDAARSASARVRLTSEQFNELREAARGSALDIAEAVEDILCHNMNMMAFATMDEMLLAAAKPQSVFGGATTEEYLAFRRLAHLRQHLGEDANALASTSREMTERLDGSSAVLAMAHMITRESQLAAGQPTFYEWLDVLRTHQLSGEQGQGLSDDARKAATQLSRLLEESGAYEKYWEGVARQRQRLEDHATALPMALRELVDPPHFLDASDVFFVSRFTAKQYM